MVWVFAKDGQHTRCEIAHDAAADAAAPGYRIIVRHPDRQQTVETLADPVALIDRALAVMRDLHRDGWTVL
jgi:hypothetical protein